MIIDTKDVIILPLNLIIAGLIRATDLTGIEIFFTILAATMLLFVAIMSLKVFFIEISITEESLHSGGGGGRTITIEE